LQVLLRIEGIGISNSRENQEHTHPPKQRANGSRIRKQSSNKKRCYQDAIKGDISRPCEVADVKSSGRRPHSGGKAQEYRHPKNADLNEVKNVQSVEVIWFAIWVEKGKQAKRDYREKEQDVVNAVQQMAARDVEVDPEHLSDGPHDERDRE